MLLMIWSMFPTNKHVPARPHVDLRWLSDARDRVASRTGRHSCVSYRHPLAMNHCGFGQTHVVSSLVLSPVVLVTNFIGGFDIAMAHL